MTPSGSLAPRGERDSYFLDHACATMSVGLDIIDAWRVKQDRLKFNFDKARAVLIDSNMLSHEVMAGILGGFGFRQLHRFADIARGQDFLKANPVELVFVDPYTYGEAGLDFIRWAHDNCARTPIFVVTGHAFLRAVTEARDAGADYVIAKPYSPSVLLERLIWVAEQSGRKIGATDEPMLHETAGVAA